MVEMTPAMIVFFVILGLCSGIFSTALGLGGGLIVIPALTFCAAIPQKNAQGIALAIMVPMALMGALRYHWNPEIHLDYRVIAILALTVVIGSNIGAEIVERVSNKTLRVGFGVVMLTVSIQYILELFRMNPHP